MEPLKLWGILAGTFTQVGMLFGLCFIGKAHLRARCRGGRRRSSRLGARLSSTPAVRRLRTRSASLGARLSTVARFPGSKASRSEDSDADASAAVELGEVTNPVSSAGAGTRALVFWRHLARSPGSRPLLARRIQEPLEEGPRVGRPGVGAAAARAAGASPAPLDHPRGPRGSGATRPGPRRSLLVKTPARLAKKTSQNAHAGQAGTFVFLSSPKRHAGVVR